MGTDTENDRPVASSAEVSILFHGYADDTQDPSVSRVASTVGYVRDGTIRVIIDPGMVPKQSILLDALAALGGVSNLYY
ncbi:MAG: hypothetical protein NVSMB27_44190 [Ktedonobacteraceae bacterium]